MTGNGKPSKDDAEVQAGWLDRAFSRDNSLMRAMDVCASSECPATGFEEADDLGPGYLGGWLPPILGAAFREWVDGTIREAAADPSYYCHADECRAFIEGLQEVRFRFFGAELEL